MDIIKENIDSPENMTESQVIDRILKGDKSFYHLIVRKFNTDLYRIGRSYNYNHEDSQDLMQETYLDAFRNLSGFEGRSSFKTWIIRIMLNNCYKKKQKAAFKNESSREINENSQPMFVSNHTDTNSLVQNRELGHIIEKALAEIPEDYRMVFSLREINGLNVSETADLLDISEANVKVRLNRAKSMLRNTIERSYSSSEIFSFDAVYCNAMAEKVMILINDL